VALQLPVNAIDAYELLRQRVVEPDGQIEHAEGRGVVIRCGLARWAQLQGAATTVSPTATRRPGNSQPARSTTMPTEIIRLVANLILSMRKAQIHA